MNQRQLFLQHLAQTSPAPIAIEPLHAQGIYVYDAQGKKFIDGISGFSVANIGHGHPKVVEAVQQQAASYMHLIVYGEFIQQPQVAYAKLLTGHLPQSLNCVYFTNSGTEAVEGAMKLAKRVTNRSKIIAFNKAYHGSTQGALSVMGGEYWRQAFRPLLPNVFHFDYGSNEVLDSIDIDTACVIVEPVQAEAGVVKPPDEWLNALRKKCNETGAVLVFDEIQTGFGRTGKLWAFEHSNAIPDILLLGKALGGGMPLGAFISSTEMMGALTNNPVLGHITTFGGHPVSCAAGKAALEVLLEENLLEGVRHKENILKTQLQHPAIKQLKTSGLWAAVELQDFETTQKTAHNCIQNGLITDWFLFANNCLRIAPPLVTTSEELLSICDIVKKGLL